MKQQYDITTKPYYRCLSCPRFRNMCGGMPTRGMGLQEWCEYVRDVMDYIGLSAAYVAEKADVSQRKVESIHAINVEQDIMRSTARRVELVVLGQATKHICSMDFDADKYADQIAALREEVAYWRKENDRKAKIIDKYLN